LVAGYFSCVVADSAQAFGCVVAVAEFFIGTFFCGQLAVKNKIFSITFLSSYCIAVL
jgi:hypothetical protein